ncbi:MAG: CRTAC1 family protein [Solirubrobacterales bacterium]
MRNRRRSSPSLLVALTLSVLLNAAPVEAGTAHLTITLASRDGVTRLEQGRTLRYAAILRNDGSAAELVNLELGLERVATGASVPFWRATTSVGANSTMKIRGRVTTGQWFPKPGTFRIVATAPVPVEPLEFRVTKPGVVIPRFQDVTADAGLSFTDAHPIECDNLAGGTAWGDIEGDGDPDLYVPQKGAPARLYVNDGTGHFTEEAASRGVANPGRDGVGAVFVDYDNDGDPDLYVVNFEGNRLYRNNGSGLFADVTSTAGVAGTFGMSSASWGDFDRDGYVDLYVAAWGDCSAGGLGSLQYGPDVLYHNNGNGTFTDVTQYIGGAAATMGAGFEAAWFDYDHDGDLDIYLANDYLGSQPKFNVLWRNDGPDGSGGWLFTNVAASAGVDYRTNTMGIGLADYDHDLDMDMALSNIEANRLFRNDGDGTFTDVAYRAGVARDRQRVGLASVTWGLEFNDLNLDTWEDLYMPAGSLRLNDPEDQPNATLVNAGDGTFLDLSAASHANDPQASRSAAMADYDLDGRMDLYVFNQGGQPKLFRNVTDVTGKHWLEIDLNGTLSNADGCGAWVVATLDSGAKLLRQVFCGSVGLASGSWPSLHYGLGSSTSVSSLRIEWPSGVVQTLSDVAADQLLTVTEPTT